jgi:hypothetical protein
MIAVVLVRSVARTRTYINNNTHRGRKKKEKKPEKTRDREKKTTGKKYYLALLPQAIEREREKENRQMTSSENGLSLTKNSLVNCHRKKKAEEKISNITRKIFTVIHWI